jgi:hypothetical protein
MLIGVITMNSWTSSNESYHLFLRRTSKEFSKNHIMCLTVFFISKVYCLASFGDENKNKSMIVVTILLSLPPSPPPSTFSLAHG